MATEKITALQNALQATENGFETNIFRSICADVEILIDGIAKNGCTPCYRLFGYDEAGKEILVFEKTLSVKADGCFSYVHFFDPVSLAVYQNAVSFRIRITGDAKSGSYELTKLDMIEYEQDASDAAKANQPRKKRGPHPLKKVLFVGNSILLGMENRYGMCATSPKNDYFYHVSEAIKKRYPDCECFKLHASGIEHSESVEAFEDAFYHLPNTYTGRPASDSFTSDLDLVILQMTDNVNTEQKQAVFYHTSDLLLSHIREQSPNAVILWVYGWYYKRPIYPRLMEVCDLYDVEKIDVRSLRYKANEAKDGTLYESIDGTKKEASPLWLTHPGDAGMKAIADQIISALKETEIL